MADHPTRIHLKELCCPSEEPMVRNQLRTVPGVQDVRFDHVSKSIEVRHAPGDEARILEALNQAGLGATLAEQPASAAVWMTGPLATALALAAGSELAVWRGWPESSWAVVGSAGLAMLCVGLKPWTRALANLRRGQLGIQTLMVVAVVGAIALGQWPEAAMVLALFSWSELLENYSLSRVRGALEELLQSAPETAEVERDGTWVTRPVTEVAVGDRVRLRPGDKVPVDGRIVEGRSALNQAALTGESLPVDKEVGDSVWAGSLNVGGALTLEVTQGAGSRQLDRIVQAVRQAQMDKAPIQSFIDRFAAYYTPVVLLAALSLAVVPYLSGWPHPELWVYRALVLLVVSCPCALVLSTPVTLVSGLTAAASRGVLVKGARALEEAARIRLVALDKTGTLTRGEPSLVATFWTGDDQMAMVASLQEPSSHPLARALHGLYPGPLKSLDNWRQEAGRGVAAEHQGRSWELVAHRHWDSAAHPELQARLQEWEQRGYSTSVLLEAGEPRGLLAFSDSLRPESAEALRRLHQLGLQTLMLSGDRAAAAAEIGRQVGIQQVAAELMPGDKLSRIEAELARLGHVAMVGDGINDAPALARASLGVAIGQGGSATAVEVGDVVLLQPDLRRLADFFELARTTRRRLLENISLSLGSKLAFVALALVGKATLWMAVLADVGACLVVVANGLRLLRRPVERAELPAAKSSCCSGHH